MNWGAMVCLAGDIDQGASSLGNEINPVRTIVATGVEVVVMVARARLDSVQIVRAS